jgi:hypothetical protein
VHFESVFPFITPKKCNYYVYDIIVTSLWYVATWQRNIQGVHTKLRMHLIHVCSVSVIGPRADDSQVNKLEMNWIIRPSPSSFGKVHVATILCVFAKLRKTTISFVMYVCPSVRLSVRMELGSYRTDCHEIWYPSIFRKSVQKIQV